MISDPSDWHQALARVSGQLVRGEQRAKTQELLEYLGVPVTDRACRRLRRVMRDLGWRGPRLMRFGGRTLKGYSRHPMVGLPAIVQEEPAAEAATTEPESLAPELAAATRLALEKMTQLLKIPTDRGDGNLLRAQTAAAGIAITAQLRVDEAKLKEVRSRDVMARLIEMMAQEKAKLVELEAQLAEMGSVNGKGGPVAARTEDSGINIVPAQDANDRA
jgi:hypothetical protein